MRDQYKNPQSESVLFETIVDGAIMIDSQGRILKFNPACVKIFGYEPEEVLGQNVKMLMPMSYRREHDGYISNYLKTGEAKIIGIGREVTGARKDGSEFPMELSVGVSQHSDPPYFIGIVRDVTERKQMELELANQARDLRLSLENERQIRDMQREFLSMATHEFRTPLAVIDAAAQRLSSIDKGVPDPEETKKRIESIRNNVKRITGLIDSTLQNSQADAGKIALNIENMDLIQTAQEVAMRHNEAQGWERVDFEQMTDQLSILGDPKLITSVIDNVVANACKYSPDDKAVHVRVWQDGKWAGVTVSDHGPGIAHDELSRVFERYYRSRSMAGVPGTGLGLHLTRKLLDMHKGNISVQSVVGHGATFTIKLPLSGS